MTNKNVVDEKDDICSNCYEIKKISKKKLLIKRCCCNDTESRDLEYRPSFFDSDKTKITYSFESTNNIFGTDDISDNAGQNLKRGITARKRKKSQDITTKYKRQKIKTHNIHIKSEQNDEKKTIKTVMGTSSVLSTTTSRTEKPSTKIRVKMTLRELIELTGGKKTLESKYISDIYEAHRHACIFAENIGDDNKKNLSGMYTTKDLDYGISISSKSDAQWTMPCIGDIII